MTHHDGRPIACYDPKILLAHTERHSLEPFFEMARTRKSPRSVLPGQRLRRRMASRAALVTNAELDGFVVKRVPTSEMLPAHYQNGHYSIYELERRRPCGAT